MTLHQINQLSYTNNTESLWQQSLKQGDAVLLIEEAILRLTQPHSTPMTLLEENHICLYYLQRDAEGYGVQPSLGKALSDTEWVELTFFASSHISW
ncbi:DsrH/TusB family sulfur metabolism protein [Marinomonas posidonica]|uniref:DsrH/TusB family sulfur metabolism protein n=1 Tax=Marinomonas posidonica TaxID=936476 RepID=UPI003735CD24